MNILFLRFFSSPLFLFEVEREKNQFSSSFFSRWFDLFQRVLVAFFPFILKKNLLFLLLILVFFLSLSVLYHRQAIVVVVVVVAVIENTLTAVALQERQLVASTNIALHTRILRPCWIEPPFLFSRSYQIDLFSFFLFTIEIQHIQGRTPVLTKSNRRVIYFSSRTTLVCRSTLKQVEF